MLDQVGIVDSETFQLEETINTDFNDISCMDYTSDISCNMVDSCEWTMDMCMESGGGMQMSNNTPHFIAVDDLNGYWLGIHLYNSSTDLRRCYKVLLYLRDWMKLEIKMENDGFWTKKSQKCGENQEK